MRNPPARRIRFSRPLPLQRFLAGILARQAPTRLHGIIRLLPLILLIGVVGRCTLLVDLDTVRLEARQVGTGFSHLCYLGEDGVVTCLGINAMGQVGVGEEYRNELLPPRRLAIPDFVTSISVSSSHSCAVTLDGRVFCWGSNLFFRAGAPDEDTLWTPTQVMGLPQAAKVWAGASHTCVMGADGSLHCFGNNDKGQLTSAALEGDVANPVEISLPSGRPVAQAAVGDWHSCARDLDGRLFCWGDNTKGQLGLGFYGEGSEVRDATAVPALVGLEVTDVQAGAEHTCAILANGEARCWGDNRFRQIGDDSSVLVRATADVPLAGPEGPWILLSAAESHSCGLSGERVFCWGANGFGQLGVGGDVFASSTPLPVPLLENVLWLSVHGQTSCALLGTHPDRDGEIWCWGDSREGQLGLRDTWYSIPRPISR